MVFFIAEHNVLDHLQLLSLYSSVASLCDMYTGPPLPKKVFDKAVELNFTARRGFPLKEYISAVFGRDAFVATGIMTRQGHSIGKWLWRGRGKSYKDLHLLLSSRLFYANVFLQTTSLLLKKEGDVYQQMFLRLPSLEHFLKIYHCLLTQSGTAYISISLFPF